MFEGRGMSDPDPGILEGPVLVFGGPYSNLQATEAVIAESRRLGIPARHVICTGDVVAYCADPEATTTAIRQFGCPVVRGNCEENLGFGKQDCGCGFAENSVCDRLSAMWFRYAAEHLSEASKAWMRTLPGVIRFRIGERRVAVIHGGVDNISEFLFASDPIARKRAIAARLGADLVLAGHTGLPFIQELGNATWVNAGVVGVPANDGTRRGWYALINPQGHAHLKPLNIDQNKAAAAMRANGLPEEYARSLETGLWADMSILPETERRAQGIALES